MEEIKGSNERKMEDRKKISVIVPIYNSEQYLRTCLDSIIQQTYSDIEIILIDDGSTDLSGWICDEYEKQYDNIRVYHQNNAGAIASRRRGVELATGDCIAFVDSDDWLERDFYEKMLSVPDSQDADIITSGSIYEWENKTENITDSADAGIYYKDDIKESIWGCMAYDKQRGGQGITPFMWNKLFKKECLQDVIKNIDTDITYNEDGATVYTLLIKISKLVVTHYCGYHYRQRKDSAIHTYSLASFEKMSILQRCMKREILRGSKNDILEEQIDQYVAHLIDRGVASVYGIQLVKKYYLFPFHLVPKNSKIILYGAGLVGKAYYYCIKNKKYVSLVAWVDKNYSALKLEEEIESPDVISQKVFDYIVIAINNEKIAMEIKQEMRKKGISENKIIWEKPEKLSM